MLKKINNNFRKKYLNPLTISIPGDPSSAAFFTALTLLNKKFYAEDNKCWFKPELELVFINY